MMVVTNVPCARKVELEVVMDLTFVPITCAQGTLVTLTFE